jgi:hypothetical protein
MKIFNSNRSLDGREELILVLIAGFIPFATLAAAIY